MTRRISARLREEAAVACAQMATWWSSPLYDDQGAVIQSPDCGDATDAWSLADLAFNAAEATSPRSKRVELDAAWMWAEAEALLRTKAFP